MSQKPSVGRIVHYHDPIEAARWGYAGQKAPAPLAAIITGVVSDTLVHLTVFRPGSAPEPTVGPPTLFGTETGCWSWPERV